MEHTVDDSDNAAPGPLSSDNANSKQTAVIEQRTSPARGNLCHTLGTVREIDQFAVSFPEIDFPQTATPRFSWEQLERQLKFLAGTPQRRAMVGDRVASIRKLSGHKPEEMVLQEILIEAWVLLDEEPHGDREAD